MALVIAPQPWLIFLDDLGALVPNGQLAIYAAGTTTPATVYADSAGTAHPWPITLDGAGRVPGGLYLDAGIAYKVVLHAPKIGSVNLTGAIIKSQDNVFDDGGTGGTVPNHAPTHNAGGSDPITALDAAVLTQGTIPDARLSVNVLKHAAGYPGNTTNFLRADGAFAVPPGSAGFVPPLQQVGNVIANTTADGADTGYTGIAGGGGAGQTRGAVVNVLGNEHPTNPGEVHIGMGPNGHLYLFNDGGAIVAQVDGAGNLIVSGVAGNVALKTVMNLFTASQVLSLASPYWLWSDTGGAVDAKNWRLLAQSGVLYVQALNDAQNVSQALFAFDRAGNFSLPGQLTAQGQPTAFVAMNTPGAVPIGSIFTFTFDTIGYSVGNTWSAGNPTIFYAHTAGTYAITAEIVWSYSNVGTRMIRFLRNSAVPFGLTVVNTTRDEQTCQVTTSQVLMNAGDYIQLQVKHNSDVPLSVSGSMRWVKIG